jgi:hypothetical protein
MTEKPRNDDPAFPLPNRATTSPHTAGLTVREYAAIHILAGIAGDGVNTIDPSRAARLAVAAANELIAVLSGADDRAPNFAEMLPYSTFRALRASIEKWDQHAVADDYMTISLGRKDCPLCELFNTAEHDETGTACQGCPVMKATGTTNCHGTPYHDAWEKFQQWRAAANQDLTLTTYNRRLEFRDAAKKEADFLRSLLPSVGSTGGRP